MMPPKLVIDTNILLVCISERASQKNNRAWVIPITRKIHRSLLRQNVDGGERFLIQ